MDFTQQKPSRLVRVLLFRLRLIDPILEFDHVFSRGQRNSFLQATDQHRKASNLCLLQLVLTYFFHIFSVVNFLLIFSAKVKRLHINGNCLDCSGKLIIPFFIIIRYRSFIIHLYINSFIAGKSIWLRLWDFAFSDLLAIDIQDRSTTGPRLTAVKYKLIFDSMLTGSNWSGRGNVSVFKSKIV